MKITKHYNPERKAKGTSHGFIFFSLTDIFAYLEIFPMYQIIHQSSPAEIAHLVQEDQIFAVYLRIIRLINLSQQL